MSKRKIRIVSIRNPLPLKEQETAIVRMHGEPWTVDTSQPTVARELQRKGHAAVQHDPAGHYLRFYLPTNANTFRDLAAVLSPHQAKNLPNKKANTTKNQGKPSKVGEKSTAEREIEEEEDSSVDLAETEPRKGPKSSKVGECDDDHDSEVLSERVKR